MKFSIYKIWQTIAQTAPTTHRTPTTNNTKSYSWRSQTNPFTFYYFFSFLEKNYLLLHRLHVPPVKSPQWSLLRPPIFCKIRIRPCITRNQPYGTTIYIILLFRAILTSTFSVSHFFHSHSSLKYGLKNQTHICRKLSIVPHTECEETPFNNELTATPLYVDESIITSAKLSAIR